MSTAMFLANRVYWYGRNHDPGGAPQYQSGAGHVKGLTHEPVPSGKHDQKTMENHYFQ